MIKEISPRRYFLTTVMSVLLCSSAYAEGIVQSVDDRLLEQRVLTEFSNYQIQAQPAKPRVSFKEALGNLKKFRRAAANTPKCTDQQKSVFANRYVLSVDSAGKPCRIYDLSFPTLKTLFSAKNTMQVPVQKLTSKDYLNWLDGDSTAMEQNREIFRRTFNSQVVAKNSWVSKLKFKIRPPAVDGSRANASEIGLPMSFKLTDLDIGSTQFDSQTQAEIKEFISELQAQEGSMSSVETDYMVSVLKSPEALFDGIQFNWNDLQKVYDVILDGDFLPFSGPVALVDFQIQYKYAVQKMFRSILSSGLQSLAKRIPNPMMSSAVEVLVNDAFEQMEMAYSYQMVLLEETLRTAALGRLDIGMDATATTRALNLLHGQRSDLVTAYITAVAQGKPFDWNSFENLGRTARYTVEKQRDVLMNKMNSKLVLEKNCQNEFVMDYFASCTKAGAKDAIYSLISEQVVFNKSFGAPMVYRYKNPQEAAMKRGTAWVLSIALRVFGLPIARSAVNQLDPVIKSFVTAGVLDEALMRSVLSHQFRAGRQLDADNSSMLKWLYIQNLNPFLPKSLESEDRVIATNKRLIGLN